MNIYLDIDGTLITNDFESKPADGLHEFLEYLIKNHTCYWLTTHCRRDGDIEHVYEYLRPILPPETFELTKSIKPTVWEILKTEAIDFESDFRWFDDSVTTMELMTLENKGASKKLVNVNLKETPLLSLVAKNAK